MESLERYSIETASDLLGFTKEQIYRYATEELLSLAVDLHLSGTSEFTSIYGGDKFKSGFFNHRAYLYSSCLHQNRDSILKNGELPLHAVFSRVSGFYRFPAGHPDFNLASNCYKAVYASDQYYWWHIEQHGNVMMPVYLTKQAVFSSPITKGVFASHAVADPAIESEFELESSEPHKYGMWQKAVDDHYQKNKRLSHSAICVKLESALGINSETLRRWTKNPKKV